MTDKQAEVVNEVGMYPHYLEIRTVRNIKKLLELSPEDRAEFLQVIYDDLDRRKQLEDAKKMFDDVRLKIDAAYAVDDNKTILKDGYSQKV